MVNKFIAFKLKQINLLVKTQGVLICCLLLFCLQANKVLGGENFSLPIDIVYLWVNGSDPEWLKIKNSFSPKNADVPPDAVAKNRYSDNDELRYSLRSVLKYAPFFNHIYIVTMNQVPSWLSGHPKITIVDHAEIFKNLKDLPTFNSMAIECNLHRIPNLSEHFIYFNDDMFFGSPVKPCDFFTQSGKVKVLFEKHAYTPSGTRVSSEITFLSACRNTNVLLNKQYKNEGRLFISHAPYALVKSYMEQSENEFADVFTSTASHRFRTPEDYTITNGLLQYHWKYQGLVEQGRMTNAMICVSDDDMIKKTKKALRTLCNQRPQTFCIQDKMNGKCDLTKMELHKFFEDMYPDTAPWEK